MQQPIECHEAKFSETCGSLRARRRPTGSVKEFRFDPFWHPMKTKPIVKQLTALYWAQAHMKEAIALCDLASGLSKEQTTDEVYFGLWTGAVVAYARSFTQNDGISALGAEFKQFPTVQYQRHHEQVIELRHNAHCHKSRVWELSNAKTPEDREKLGRILVEILPDGNTEYEITRRVLPISYFADIKRLCLFQLERLVAESNKQLKHLLESHSAGPGTYDLEKDL
jgi:hypothetical protein